jgi:7-cyano-7-deazaguanine reductase
MALRTLSLDPNGMPVSLSLSGQLVCQCPINGLQDSAVVEVSYIPTASVVDLASFAAYLRGFAGRAVLHEAATIEIVDAVKAATEADDVTVRTTWEPVEGVGCTVVAHG